MSVKEDGRICLLKKFGYVLLIEVDKNRVSNQSRIVKAGEINPYPYLLNRPTSTSFQDFTDLLAKSGIIKEQRPNISSAIMRHYQETLIT